MHQPISQTSISHEEIQKSHGSPSAKNLASSSIDQRSILQIFSKKTAGIPVHFETVGISPEINYTGIQAHESQPTVYKSLIENNSKHNINLSLLTSLVNKYKHDWKKITKGYNAELSCNRSLLELKQFFNQERELNKLYDVKFTEEEDGKIVKLIDEKGFEWESIAVELAGRSEISIRNRYYSSLKKRISLFKGKQEADFEIICANSNQVGNKLLQDFNQANIKILNENIGILKETKISELVLEEIPVFLRVIEDMRCRLW